MNDYVTGDRYRWDSEVVADQALAYAKTVKLPDNGKNAWIFNIDEALLSNVPWYAACEFE